MVVPEQKARTTHDNILRLSDDPDVNNAIKFLREREIVHFQRFGEAIQLLRENSILTSTENEFTINKQLKKQCLQGRVKFPIGGKVRERESADLVQFQNRQYSLDLKKVCQSCHGSF